MSTFNPVIGMIHNQKENKWHPVLFTENPLPGGGPMRFKSKMHHTGGFHNRQDAMTGVLELAAHVESSGMFVGPVQFLKINDPETDIAWDGEGIPAMVEFFTEDMLTDE